MPWIHYLMYKPMLCCTSYYRFIKYRFFLFKGWPYFLWFQNGGLKQDFSILFKLYSDHTNLVRNLLQTVTQFFQPQGVEKICFKYQNQLKREFGQEGYVWSTREVWMTMTQRSFYQIGVGTEIF